ncbi:bifunctional phosphopantothenoylcysteine decarboxylase/phosphopantothenate--cysteine ligase CoaBC [Nitrolancea hollandica]|uniref:Coenzyme A biosynthesis bifunctional protein CoaBC n=1 Tax=Nitrolancea hollandica Lb TaxID=1129897 RepID=I4EER8_9BACT|nr:bifunctional phosphopantothenoylcysteine decarboxylase/phosphopantothenate--cysteine ligase CoaBC [Nitrolancea hollandica]CCF83180.1 Coenzyme A biosynthesis bifunctional protein coaBC (Includes: Phosphopantothenoylcysteine decarboxylase; Phosphopantothenate--cysteine ligase) [Nitrolancea hollandica Lb]
MPRILQHKRVVLGVSGGIAAYKMVEVARDLTLAGALVDVMLTQAALEFVTPLPFQTLTRRRVYTTVFEPWTEAEQGHVSIGEQADILVIAPATANLIAKLAHGLVDDMLTATVLASSAPLIIAPAMDHLMYRHPATQENLATLERRGARIIGPDQGPLASGIVGFGRLVPPARLLAAIRATLGARGPLAGKRVVVTAGPTLEAIDPIRFLGNRSSGRMGYALAEAALDAGAAVTLISGPVSLPAPPEATVVPVESAAQMLDAVRNAIDDADILVMSAAVADFRPVQVAEQKIKKGASDRQLQLTRTVDILASIDRPGLIKVGFAAETTNLLEHARDKLLAKRLDLLVANDAVGTMGSATSRASLLRPSREPEGLPMMSKEELAEVIIDRIAQIRPSTIPVAAGS